MWEAFFCRCQAFPGQAFPRQAESISGGRLLAIPFLRRKRYSIPAQNGVTYHSGRIWQLIPAQAATISLSAQKKIPHSGAERCHRNFRAYLAPFSRAGGYNFPFCAEKDTPFRRGTVSRKLPSGFSTVFPHRRLEFPFLR